MSIPLPGGADPDLDRQQKFDALAQAIPSFGGRTVEIRFGTSTVTFTASAASASTTVAHGLGKTPVTAYVTYRHAAASTILFTPYIDTVGATNIGISATASTVLTGPITVDWLVIA